MPLQAKHPMRTRAMSQLALVGMLFAGLLTATAARAQPVAPQSTLTAGAQQVVVVNQTLPTRFAARLATPQGAPLPGVTVHFAINLCLEGTPPPGGGCPTVALYGTFADGSPEDLSTTAVTDADGVATAAAFVAGSVPGTYEVFMSVPEQQVGSLQILYGAPFLFYGITQVAGLPRQIPASHPWGLVLLAALAMLLAQRALQRRDVGPNPARR